MPDQTSGPEKQPLFNIEAMVTEANVPPAPDLAPTTEREPGVFDNLSPFSPSEGFGLDGMPPVEETDHEPTRQDHAAYPLGRMVGAVTEITIK